MTRNSLDADIVFSGSYLLFISDKVDIDENRKLRKLIDRVRSKSFVLTVFNLMSVVTVTKNKNKKTLYRQHGVLCGHVLNGSTY